MNEITNKFDNKVLNYDFIDFMKLIGSVAIFSMHAWDQYVGSNAYSTLVARWGVPFFFIASSFFLFSKEKNGNIEKSALIRYVKRIASLYLVWAIINIPNIIQRNLDMDFNVESYIRLGLTFILSSSFMGSWYLVSSIWSAVIIYLLSKKLNTKQVLIITSIVQLLCILCSSYVYAIPSGIFSVLTYYLYYYLYFPLNAFGGLFYFALGKYIFENKEKLTKYGTGLYAVLFVIMYLGYAVEQYGTIILGFNRTTDQSFMIVPSAVVLFLFSLKINIKVNNARLLRKLSTIIYCAHGNVLTIFVLFSDKLHLNSFIPKYLLSVVLLALICVVVLLIQKNKKLKFVKYLT